MGVVSFVLAVVCGGGILCILALLWLAKRWEEASGKVIGEDASELGLLVLFFVLMGHFFLLVAVVLGIAGMLQRRRRRLYAVLGTVVSAVVLTLGSLTLLMPICQQDRCSLPLEPPPKIHYAKEPPEG